MDNLLFLSCAYSQDKREEYLHNSKRGYQFAAQNFQESLLQGFIENNIKPYVLSFPVLSAYPSGYSHAVIHDCNFVYNNIVLGKSFGYCNLPLIKHLSYNKLKKQAIEWCKNKSGLKYVLVYGMIPGLMKIAVFLKNKFKQLKIAIIIPDIPEYFGCNKWVKLIGIHKINIKSSYSLLPFFDAYVLLTEEMRSKLKIKRSHSSIIEGIYSIRQQSTKQDIKKSANLDIKIILYSGGLMFRYGVGLLVDAFMKIKNENYRLYLCGFGDAVNYINHCANLDHRIEYKGMLPKEKIYELQHISTLLVNPRKSDEEFTKYSFPSKTMEYMASGTPVVMTHLKCLPKEYEKYLFFFDEESVNGYATKIEQICELPDSERQDLGRRASDFIMTQKNAFMQVKKIINLLYEC